MDRWDWMAIRAYAPAVGALVFAAVAMIVVTGWQANPSLTGFVEIGRWVSLLGLAVTGWLVAAPTYRLLRWQRGAGPCCPNCDGPLGHERAGYANRGGAYRKCYACGDNVNHRHYE